MPKSKKAKSAPSVCNLILPVKVDHLKGIAQTLLDDGKLTVSDVNGGRFSADEVAKLWGKEIHDDDENLIGYTEGSMNDAFYRDMKSVPAVPAAHQPVLLLAAKKLGMTFAFVGQAKRAVHQPDPWPSHLPAWKEGYTVGDAGGRAQAIKDVRRNVTDEKYIVKVGTYEYVIGDDKSNAIHNIHGSKGDNNYGWNVRAVKKLAFRGRDKEIANIVFQINNGISTVPWEGDRTTGSELVMLPNMIATAGYLVKGGKTLTYAQIREAVESGNTKGIRFKVLSKPIVGNAVTRAQLVAAVKKMMQANSTNEKGNTAWDLFVKSQKGKTQDDKIAKAEHNIWYNVESVQTRNNPLVTYCFGLRNSVIHQPLATVYGDDRNDKRITCLIGLRCGDQTTYESAEAIREALTSEETRRPKRKLTKSETAPDPEDVPVATEITDTSDDEPVAVAVAEGED